MVGYLILYHLNPLEEFCWVPLILWPPTEQNGQTHSDNLSATVDKLFECVWPKLK